MAGVFEPVSLSWNGEEFVIPSDRVMGAIARVEDVVTLKELYDVQRDRGTVKMSTLAAAFGTVLRYAGAAVTDDQVYSGMFGEDAAKAAQEALLALIALMVPPEKLRATNDNKPPPGKAEPAAAA